MLMINEALNQMCFSQYMCSLKIMRGGGGGAAPIPTPMGLENSYDSGPFNYMHVKSRAAYVYIPTTQYHRLHNV